MNQSLKKQPQTNGLATTQATHAQVNGEHHKMQKEMDRLYWIYSSLLKVHKPKDKFVIADTPKIKKRHIENEQIKYTIVSNDSDIEEIAPLAISNDLAEIPAQHPPLPLLATPEPDLEDEEVQVSWDFKRDRLWAAEVAEALREVVKAQHRRKEKTNLWVQA